jgi:hypothetical protein
MRADTVVCSDTACASGIGVVYDTIISGKSIEFGQDTAFMRYPVIHTQHCAGGDTAKPIISSSIRRYCWWVSCSNVFLVDEQCCFAGADCSADDTIVYGFDFTEDSILELIAGDTAELFSCSGN